MSPRRAAPRARLAVEHLEDRWVPAVTFHGGAVLPNVEVQGLYYGSDWWTNSGYYNQTGYLEGFLNNVVHSSYMDMLNKAGYGVGRGSFDQGWVDGTNLNKSQYLSDGQIQGALVANINAGHLKAPDGNRLYVVFVEDNVAVGNSSSNSQNNFLGYHGSFGSWVFPPSGPWLGEYANIRYAVVTYPGGSVNNAGLWWLSQINSMTVTTSHELAEAVTDPDPTHGWNDDGYQNGEVGDLANAQTVFLNGYSVQRIADKNDQPMTPLGATGIDPVNFVLRTDGTLYMSSSSGLTYLTSGVASLSDQSIDNYGRAMVDIVQTNGHAWEYHEGMGWTDLGTGVKSAKAGQGVSYLLYTNGTLEEYKDWGQYHWSVIDSGVTSIDAGTDRYGVNMVTEVWHGQGWEYSDSTGFHFIDYNVAAVSAGQQGFMCYLTTGGNAYSYFEPTGNKGFLSSNVAQVTAGVDQYGNGMIDLLLTNGHVWDWRPSLGWKDLGGGFNAMGKAHAGVVDTIFGGSQAWTYNGYGWAYLLANAQAAA
jgi:hypothetical protein